MITEGREASGFGSNGICWEMPCRTLSDPEVQDEQKDIIGTLVLDLDGTLTRPGSDYAVDEKAIDVLGEFLSRGGNLIICTGATCGRIERTFLRPLYSKLDQSRGAVESEQLFQHVYVMPENGSALLLSKGVSVTESEPYFAWHRLHELHVPDKRLLREIINKELIPLYKGSEVVGDFTEGPSRREYILSFKGLKDAKKVQQYIEKEIVPGNPEVNWDKIRIKAARTTIDFVHADSGKTISVAWVLENVAGLGGPVIGFGDLGDEFAKVVPTVNVNNNRPNTFRERQMPAMELTGSWELMKPDSYVITGEGAEAKTRIRKTDKELPVLRDTKGEIIFAEETENGYLSLVDDLTGRPIEIKPLTYKENGEVIAVQDAGAGTAWMIQRLLVVGYFKKPSETLNTLPR